MEKLETQDFRGWQQMGPRLPCGNSIRQDTRQLPSSMMRLWWKWMSLRGIQAVDGIETILKRSMESVVGNNIPIKIETKVSKQWTK